ncbi:hypothetical protein DSOUD_1887 [Desulfuromonas soudanensis]|uniref:Uncharacterized protein n=1 Tax=Desulfuromonas soudanensis TaxID=1603606 RepID=A0A0M3QFQ9_9BACT|nr:hypothetical protein [Desulfuromonas soudanensis]ALC16659.1 hypothetical protein DSOUD_1887 [Desulfuromonas soudanensis]
MAKQGKKRVSITVNAEQFDRVSELLRERDFPVGYLSFYLNRCLTDLDDYLGCEPHEDMTALEELKLDLMLKENDPDRK